VKKSLKSVNIWQSYKQERCCLIHFVRLATTLLKDEESARDNRVLACNFAKYSPVFFRFFGPPFIYAMLWFIHMLRLVFVRLYGHHKHVHQIGLMKQSVIIKQ